MTKVFCDYCEMEITDKNPNVVYPRVQFHSGDWKFEVIVSHKGASNSGHLCRPCAKELFQRATISEEK